MNLSFVTSKLILFADPGAKGLSGSEKGVLLAIADHLWQKDHAWPDQITIAHYAGISRRQVVRVIETLVQREILVRKYRNGQKSNDYTISIEKLLTLITNPKYKQQAEALTAVRDVSKTATETSNEQVKETVRSDTVTLSVVTPCHRRSDTVSPEKTQPYSKNKPKPNPERDRSSNREGEEGAGYPDSVSDFIHHPELSERVRNLEARLLNQTQFRYSSTLSAQALAPRVGKLFKDWKQELGVYPEDWMIAAVLASKQFRGVQNLNWGLLTSLKGKGTPYRERLFKGVVQQFRDHHAANASNAGSARPARVADPENDPTYCIGSDW